VHQTDITLEEFDDLLADFEINDRCEMGSALSITGRPPDLGPVVAIRDDRTVTLLTQRPLSFNRIPDAYSLEKAIAQMAHTRSSLKLRAAPSQSAAPTAQSRPSNEEMPQTVRGMLTWLGIDPAEAAPSVVSYAREVFSHAHAMAVLPPAKLAELRSHLISDLKKLAA
jgi:hypothetical protein